MVDFHAFLSVCRGDDRRAGGGPMRGGSGRSYGGSNRFDGGYQRDSYGGGDRKKNLGGNLKNIKWDVSSLIPFEKDFYEPTAKVNAR